MGLETCDYISLATVVFGVLLAVSEYLGYTDKTEAASISEIVFNSAKALTNRSVPETPTEGPATVAQGARDEEPTVRTPINVKRTSTTVSQ